MGIDSGGSWSRPTVSSRVGGKRVSAVRCFLDSVLSRTLLHVATNIYSKSDTVSVLNLLTSPLLFDINAVLL
jgi:hypothetical protein